MSSFARSVQAFEQAGSIFCSHSSTGNNAARSNEFIRYLWQVDEQLLLLQQNS